MITMDNGIEIKRFDDFNFDCEINHDNPSTPNTSAKTLSIPGKPGLLYFGEDIGEKPFSFNLTMHEQSYEKAQTKLNELNAFLFDSFGQPRNLKIIFDYEADKFYNVAINGSLIPIREFFEKTMPINFVAYDPYKYSGVYADEITWGSTKVTFEYTYLLGREGLTGAVTVTSPQNVSVDIAGLAVKPIFEITGSATNLIITANTEKINVGTFLNTTWVIDTENFESFKNGVETMLDMNHFWLLPGKQSINFSGTNLNFTVRIKYRDKYQ